MICSVDGCDGTVRAKGFCAKHYARFHRHGDPSIVLKPSGYGRPVPRLEKMDDFGHTFDPADDRHGTVNGYINLGCRCTPCTEANTERHYEYMHGDPNRLEQHRLRERERRRRGAT